MSESRILNLELGIKNFIILDTIYKMCNTLNFKKRTRFFGVLEVFITYYT